MIWDRVCCRPINARAASQSPPVRHPRSKQPPSHGQQLAHGASISPEQVIRMLNNHHPAGAAAPGKHVPRAHDPLPPPVNLMNNMPVRTVSMSRSADSPHGFGICVKGGRESGLLMLFTRPFFIALPITLYHSQLVKQFLILFFFMNFAHLNFCS
jgi:hypothetical protein